ncbi:TniQ family protein [Rhizobium sp. 60-20]|uniref:TniQ family protein n=2 Tax=Hyphomicrobiales TaxID=356 RepID=UPI000927D05E|nr:TniQ family protein [Rhizobium sp. 60-20]OJY76370.1 MAG: hypothetical protein BGP09_25680 [Rhizobium sp. 60-20]
MSAAATCARFAVEIRERYLDIARDRWPISIDPKPDELLSSWLHRVGQANGISPRSFAGVLGVGGAMWSARFDLRIPRAIAVLLSDRTEISPEALTTMAMSDWVLAPLLLPLRENANRNRSTWLQYCPLCLGEDESPYFRRQWRLASRISCFVHGCGLRDRCPACRSAIAVFDQRDLVPQHFCVRCGFDLRTARKVSVKGGARRLERAIADIFRVELARSPTTESSTAVRDVVSRVLRASAATDDSLAMSLTSLASMARIRWFEQLAGEPLDWLVADKDAAVTHRRWSILAAGGQDRLVACFADFLDKCQARPRSRRLIRRGAGGIGLADLLAAYRRVAGDRSSSKLHRDL